MKKAPSKPRPQCPECPPPKQPKKGVNYPMADAFFGIFGMRRQVATTKPRKTTTT